MARTKTSTRDDTKTLTTSWRNRHLENIYFCVFRIFKRLTEQKFLCVCRMFPFLCFFYDCSNNISKKCWVTALLRSLAFIGGLHNERNNYTKMNIYSLYPGHLGYKQCNWKVKRSTSFHSSLSYLKERGGNWLVQRSSVCKSYHRYVAEGPGLEKNKW